MVLNILSPHRLEGSGPHMQGDKGDLRPLGLNIFQQLLIKVQSCRGCRHSTGLFSIDSLIARLVLLRVGAVNIGRQRHMTNLIQHL